MINNLYTIMRTNAINSLFYTTGLGFHYTYLTSMQSSSLLLSLSGDSIAINIK